MRIKTGIATYLLISLFGASGGILWLQPTAALGQSRGTGSRHEQRGREVYTGNILYLGGPRGSVTTTFTLTIDNLTPDDEVQRFLGALQSGGQDALMKAISKEKRGTIQIGTGLGRDVNAVWVSETEEGRKITALSERWLGFGELRRGARSLDYPFTYIELFVDDRGRGEGTLIPAARVRFKKGNTIEFENFGIYPARLMNVQLRRK